MLILTFQVQIHRRANLVRHGCPGGAGVKPDVHGVSALDVLIRILLVLLRQQLLHRHLEPRIRALLRHDLLDMLHDVGREEGFLRVLVVEAWDGHTPGPLTRDAPIVAALDHRAHAVRVALRNELDLVHCRQDVLPEAINAGEPLRGRAEDDGLLAAPVVRVLVAVGLLEEQCAPLREQLADLPIGILEHVGAHKARQSDLLSEPAGVVHRRSDLQPILQAHHVIVSAMPRGRVHQSSARLRGDVVTAQHHGRLDTGDGMRVLQPLQHLALELSLHGHLGAEELGELGHEPARRDQVASLASLLLRPRGLDQRVVQRRVHGNATIGRDGPGRRGPDGNLQVLSGHPGLLERRGHLADALEGHVDRGRDVSLGVLQLCLSQCRAGRGRPVDGLPAPVDVTSADHLLEDPQLRSLILRQQREIGIVELAPDAVTLEGLALLLDSRACELGSLLAKSDGREGFPLIALHGLQHLQLNGQAMAIPARDISHLVALHRLELVDDILQDLVQGVAHVEGAVRVRWPVMKRECAHRRLALEELLIDAFGAPEVLKLRLPLRCLRPLREVGLPQENGVLVGALIAPFLALLLRCSRRRLPLRPRNLCSNSEAAEGSGGGRPQLACS
mmetsp:Transcript_47411/g.140001  ORF Transcript_47411/g.140001 Transcript_47411/m.140001 type:complete len:618 (+) Transcript_47411:1198-3051(+)